MEQLLDKHFELEVEQPHTSYCHSYANNYNRELDCKQIVAAVPYKDLIELLAYAAFVVHAASVVSVALIAFVEYVAVAAYKDSSVVELEGVPADIGSSLAVVAYTLDFDSSELDLIEEVGCLKHCNYNYYSSNLDSS